jgi:aminoglycoside phosphotransferase (APT) family kinase protein
MPSVDLDAVYALLAKSQTFSGRTIRITSIYDRHHEEKCFRVDTNDESQGYKVRLTTASSKRSVVREYEAFRLLHRHGITWAPYIYEFQADEPPYLIVGYAAGESLDKSLGWVPYTESIVDALGLLLANIHEIEGEHFGHLAGPQYPTWQAFIDVRFWRHVMPLAGAGMITEADLSKIRALYNEVGETFGSIRPLLLHGDVKPANIIFDIHQSRTTLIDFELARFGDVDFEWSKLYRLSLRWPEYQRLIAKPLLERVSFTSPGESVYDAKLLLYDFYHTCSFLDFEIETGIPVPGYRLNDLAELLQAVRRRRV